MSENLEQSPPDVASESLPPSKQAAQSTCTEVEMSVVTDSNTSGIRQYVATDAVRAASGSGLFRNQSATIFLESLVRSRETDLADAREERRFARLEGERYKENFFKEQSENAVLTERLCGDLRLKKLQNVMITLGGVMLGVGLQPLLIAFSMVYCVVAVLGMILLIIGWWYPANSKEENR